MATRREANSRVEGARGITRRTALKTAAGAVVAASALLRPRAARAAAEPIRIGFPTPLTGPFSWEATEQVRCAEIALEEFNAAGGLDGRKAELLVRDDKLKPGEAATRALELIEKDKVHFLVGALSAAVQLSVNEVAKARGVIYVSISQSDAINEVKDFSRFTFHEALNPHMTAGAVARYLFPKSKKRVAYLLADYAYGHEMVRAFKRAGDALGMSTVEEIKHPLGAQDFSPFLPRLQAARPDVLCVCNFGRDQLNSLKQASEFGMGKQMKLAVPVFLYNQRLAGGGEVFDGVVGAANYHWTLEETLKSSKAFNDKYRAKHEGAPPTDYGAYGYAGVSSLLEAVTAARSTDTAKVIAALEKLRYDKYKGPQYYRKCDHQSVQSVLVVQSKPDAKMRNKWDICDIVHVEQPDEKNLRTCAELGHTA
jgi:branched-chain amino acid transport system substrate-binding protein